MTAVRRRTRRPLLWASERTAREMGYRMVAGIDEVGLGPLAVPAVAAAVVLPFGVRLPGLDDSKKLRPVEPELIDGEGLSRARHLAMRRAVENLPAPP